VKKIYYCFKCNFSFVQSLVEILDRILQDPVRPLGFCRILKDLA